MTDSDGPWLAAGIASCEIEIATRIDCKISERLELAYGEIDRKAFRDGAKIKNQRTKQGDRLAFRVEANIPIADKEIGIERSSDRLTGAVFVIEAERFHGIADRWIECAVGFCRYSQRELHRFEKDRTDWNAHTHLGREPHHFTA